MYGFNVFNLFYIITLFKYWNQIYLVSAADDIKNFFTTDNLPADISSVNNLNLDKFALEKMGCRALQTIVDKKSR